MTVAGGGPDAAASGARRDDPVARMAALPPWWDDVLFRMFRFGVRTFSRLWFGARVEGVLPAKGPYVIAANHSSFLDPLVLGGMSQPRIVYLMTETVWRSPKLGWFYRWSRTIPLGARGGNRDALRAARAVLEQGRVVGIFPEGGISRDGLPMLGNPGAVSLVLQAGVPIVPVGIVGAHDAMPPGCGFPRRRRISIRYGQPISAVEFDRLGGGDRKARLREATHLIMQRIAELTGNVAREDVLARAGA